MLGSLLGRTRVRAALSAAAGTGFFVWLMGRGWPWWAALPAAIIFTVVVFGVMLFGLYGYLRKRQKQVALLVPGAHRAGTCGSEGQRNPGPPSRRR